MTIGIIGLGRMGMQIARRLHKNNFNVWAWNRSPGPREEFISFGGQAVETVQELISKLESPRIIWLMLPAYAEASAGKPANLVDEFLFGGSTGSPTNTVYGLSLSKALSKGDIVIDGGNSFYKDSIKRAEKLKEAGVHFFDAGTSGGIHGEQNGFSIMVGGPKEIWPTVEPIFKALAAPSPLSPPTRGGELKDKEFPPTGGEGKGGGYSYGLVGPSGSGHLVKMAHNGIEYGMMEAIAEGLAVLKASEFGNDLNFSQIAGIWSKGSVVSSWLIELTKNIFDTEDLDKVVGLIEHTGEGEWTIKLAKELGVDVRVIEDAFRVRQESKDPKTREKFSNKIVALLRKQFGGHEVKYKE